MTSSEVADAIVAPKAYARRRILRVRLASRQRSGWVSRNGRLTIRSGSSPGTPNPRISRQNELFTSGVSGDDHRKRLSTITLASRRGARHLVRSW